MLQELLAKQRVLVAAVDEVAELYSLALLLGYEKEMVEAELSRLLKRLERLNRKIDDEFND